MRHKEGDEIRPRDCVLLRAGNKKTDLPYVAKVASLWENPEDGNYQSIFTILIVPQFTFFSNRRNDDVLIMVLSTRTYGTRQAEHGQS